MGDCDSIGIYSATHQYSLVDYFATFIGFIGLATPGFLLAMILAWAANQYLGFSALGLHSKEFLDAPWSTAKALDMLQHLILPLIIIGMASAGSTIRVLRGNLLDELKKQYVVTARAKGLTETQLLFKYPVRLALNPVFSTIGWLLPAIFAGEVLISIVLSVPSIGPLLLRSTLAQDMYLTGSIVLILSALTIVGSLISDIYLAWADPRISLWRSQQNGTRISEGGLAGSAPSLDETEDRSIGSITERAEAADERFYYANPWQLVWWRFRRHRLALISLVLLVLLYLTAIFAEFVSPYTATWRAEGNADDAANQDPHHP